MSEQAEGDCRFFVSYSGVTLPLHLVNAISPDQLMNRNTYIRAWFDNEERLTGFDKLVYGDVEMAHRYDYHGNGALKQARIIMPDEEPVTLCFDESGARIL